MPNKCAAVGCSEMLTKEFSFDAFRWDLATKKWEPKHHDVLCSKHFEKNASEIADLSIQFGLKYMSVGGVHRVTYLDKFPVRISKDEALTPLPIVGPLFIFPMSFHLS